MRERSSRSLGGEGNERRDGEHDSKDSNLNSGYPSYRIQVLITKEWTRVVPVQRRGN